MKGKIIWIFGILNAGIGFYMFIFAQTVISINSRYDWVRPYTNFEAKIIMLKHIGLFLLFIGITWIGLKVYQIIYTNKHVQDINKLNQTGSSIKCLNCGLTLTSNVKVCPRCGNKITQEVHYEQNNY